MNSRGVKSYNCATNGHVKLWLLGKMYAKGENVFDKKCALLQFLIFLAIEKNKTKKLKNYKVLHFYWQFMRFVQVIFLLSSEL